MAAQRIEVRIHVGPFDKESDENLFPVGKASTTRTTYQFDGKDHPVTGNPDYDSLTAKQVDANTAEFVLKKGGKAVGRTERTVSQDGKTLTAKTTLTAANGQKTESVLVFDRQ